MKTKEELSALKEEFAAVNKKLSELSEEELTEVTGGDDSSANLVGFIGGVETPRYHCGVCNEKKTTATIRNGNAYCKDCGAPMLKLPTFLG